MKADDQYQRFCHGRLNNPYPLLRSLREEDPVHWCEPMKSWLLTRHEDVYNAFLDQRMSSQKVRAIMEQLPAQRLNMGDPVLWDFECVSDLKFDQLYRYSGL